MGEESSARTKEVSRTEIKLMTRIRDAAKKVVVLEEGLWEDSQRLRSVESKVQAHASRLTSMVAMSHGAEQSRMAEELALEADDIEGRSPTGRSRLRAATMGGIEDGARSPLSGSPFARARSSTMARWAQHASTVKLLYSCCSDTELIFCTAHTVVGHSPMEAGREDSGDLLAATLNSAQLARLMQLSEDRDPDGGHDGARDDGQMQDMLHRAVQVRGLCTRRTHWLHTPRLHDFHRRCCICGYRQRRTSWRPWTWRWTICAQRFQCCGPDQREG